MKFAALLSAIALVPVAGVAGYYLNTDPAPSFSAYAVSVGVSHIPGQDTDDWVAVALSGPNKGGAMDLAQALSFYRTQKDIERSAGGKVGYFRVQCQSYSTGAKKLLYAAHRVIRNCTSTRKTRKQAENYMVELLKPSPAS